MIREPCDETHYRKSETGTKRGACSNRDILYPIVQGKRPFALGRCCLKGGEELAVKWGLRPRSVDFQVGLIGGGWIGHLVRAFRGGQGPAALLVLTSLK